MSENEIFYGKFTKSDLSIDVSDEDDFYDLEEEHKCHYVKVRGQLYKIEQIEELNEYGFMLSIPPSDEHRFMCLWYNGGAGLHEVVEEVIESYLKSEESK